MNIVAGNSIRAGPRLRRTGFFPLGSEFSCYPPAPNTKFAGRLKHTEVSRIGDVTVQSLLSALFSTSCLVTGALALLFSAKVVPASPTPAGNH